MRERLIRVNAKLTSFKRKYYLSLFLRGSFLSIALVLFYFLVASVVEYNLWLSGWARLLIFVSFFILVLFSFFRFLREPFLFWLYRKGLDEQESARLIGSHFPDIRDRLLNLLQLSKDKNQTPLLEAGIAQKSELFDDVMFSSAIDLRENIKYLRFMLVPFVLILMILLINRGILTQGTQRILQFNREFSPAAPFRFVIENNDMFAFVNEDFTLSLKTEGDVIPEAMYLITGTRRIKLETVSAGEFAYTFEKMQQGLSFQLEASGFFSESGVIRVISRPELTALKTKLQFPAYLHKKSEELVNSGNIEIPEGTEVTWHIQTTNTKIARLGFTQEGNLKGMQMIDDQLFTLTKGINHSDQYWIDLENEHSRNKDRITYTVLVVKDQYPQIEVENSGDSVLFKTIYLGGNIEDDYGITELALNYKVIKAGKEINSRLNIPLSGDILHQRFLYRWNLDSLDLKPGDRLEYHLQVWDNDGVNGRKSSRSASFVFALPDANELKSAISRNQAATESKIEQNITKAKSIREVLDEAKQKLKGKQVLDWQDKKMLENLSEQKKEMDQMLKELQKQNELLEQKKDAFSEQNEKIKERAEKIRKLMDELLDPETRKLYEELEKLLKENTDLNQVQKMLDKMDRKEINLERELERTLSLFKQLQFDYKLDQAIGDIKQEREEQEKLYEEVRKRVDEPNASEKESGNLQKVDKQKKTEKAGNKGKDEESVGNLEKLDHENFKNKQQEQADSFTGFEKKIDELKKMADDLNEKKNLPNQSDLDDVKKDQQESKESLEKNDLKKSLRPQKNSIDRMQRMEQQMEEMQNTMEMEIDMANLEVLRQIIHGLIKLSYDQESLMKEFIQVQQSDPRYVPLSQNQLKVQDDFKVLEDSLLSLSKKDAFLSSVVTREVGELNGHLDHAAEHIRERRKPNASSEMQFSMTSINNLAIMLNNHFDMMKEMMADAKPSMGKRGKKGEQKQPGLSMLQQQLNKKIGELKNGKQEGRQFSEELAKAAAEQERIRRALREMEDKLKQEGGKGLGNEIPDKMEQTEMDLVNKQITDQTIRRQREIEVRLLEAEKSMREQDQDQERKGETAKDYDKEIPRAFEEYLRLREKEVELLKTMPPKLFPYYKKEVNEYFKRIGNRN